MTKLNKLLLNVLTDMKALDVDSIDVRDLSSFTDDMIIASGTSSRHVNAIANQVLKMTKGSDYQAIGIEGEKSGEWVLIDFGDTVLHVMLPETRSFYNIEKLWAKANSSIQAIA